MTNKTCELLLRLQRKCEVELVVYTDDPGAARDNIWSAIPDLGGLEVRTVATPRVWHRLTHVTPHQRYASRYPSSWISDDSLVTPPFDIVHLDAAVLGQLAGRAGHLGKRTVWSINDSYARTFSERRKTRGLWSTALTRSLCRYERRCAMKCDAVDVVSDHEAEYLNNMGVGNVRVLPLGRPGVPLVPFQERSANHVPVVGILSALGGDYGDAVLRFIKECWPSVLQRRPARLLVVGDRRYASSELLKAIPVMSGVDMIDRVEEQAEFFAQIDVCVVPLNQTVGLPTKALEAFTAGRPVVGARALSSLPPAWRERAFLRRDDSAAMAKAIVELLESEPRRRSLVENAQKMMAAWPTWEQYADRYLTEWPCRTPLQGVWPHLVAGPVGDGNPRDE